MKPLFWHNILKGLLAAIATAAVLLLAFAFLSLKAEDPAKYLSLYANLSLMVAAAVGGAVAARGAENGMLAGALCGALCMIAVFLPSVILSEWGAYSLLRAGLTVLAAFAGAALIMFRRSRGSDRASSRHRRMILKKYGRG